MPTIPWLEQNKYFFKFFFSVDSFLKASFVFTLTKHDIICVEDVCAVSIIYRNIKRNYKQSICIRIWVSRPVYMYHSLFINQCIYHTGMFVACIGHHVFTDPDPFIKVLQVFMVGKVAVKPFLWRLQLCLSLHSQGSWLKFYSSAINASVNSIKLIVIFNSKSYQIIHYHFT